MFDPNTFNINNAVEKIIIKYCYYFFPKHLKKILVRVRFIGRGGVVWGIYKNIINNLVRLGGIGLERNIFQDLIVFFLYRVNSGK